MYQRCYNLNTIGLRYFNVFGPRQDPKGAYPAVIPLWVASMLKGEHITINGDGTTSRDFCYIENVIQANILAAVTTNEAALNQVYNVACGDQNTLNDLFNLIKLALATNDIDYSGEPIYGEFRKGDVHHSKASIEKARTLLGYEPHYDLIKGLGESIKWYVSDLL